jgi:outer membrane protein
VAEGKKAREALQKDWEAEQKRLQNEGKKIQTAMEEFRKQSMVLDEKSRQEKEEAIQKRIMELRETEAKSSSNFQKRDQEVSEPIIKKIKNLVAKLSKDRSYSLVIDGNENVVIYSGNTDDITDDIIKLYDAKK